MNGMEAILTRIRSDGEARASEIRRSTEQACAEITARYQKEAAVLKLRLAEKNERDAKEREARLVDAAHMEAGKRLLAERQTLLDTVYDEALKKLCALPDEEYVAILTPLIVKAAEGNREGEVLFSESDRARIGQKAVDAANEKGGLALTLGKETRLIHGGFVLRRGAVEINASFETLLRLEREQNANLTAASLFPKL